MYTLQRKVVHTVSGIWLNKSWSFWYKKWVKSTQTEGYNCACTVNVKTDH